MRSLIVPIVLVAAGCGGGATSFSAAGLSLSVADEGYYITTGTDFCGSAAPGQLMLDFVDYAHICDPNTPPARDMNTAHTELKVILIIGEPPTYANNFPGAPGQVPYPISQGDCSNNGIGTDQVQFLHYGPGETTPDKVEQAESGTVSISQFDPNKVKPLMGEINVKFGSNVIKDTFKLEACN